MSDAEDAFALGCRLHGIPDPVREYRFAPPRLWRLDFAWPDHPLPGAPGLRLAVEIEGVTRSGGRHQRIGGFKEDCVKYQTALALGWLLYRVPATWVFAKRRVLPRSECMEIVGGLLRGTLPSNSYNPPS